MVHMTAPKIDKIAYLEHGLADSTYSATWSTREKDTRCAVKAPTLNAALKSLLECVPPSNVPSLYIHMGCASYSTRVHIIDAVKAVGYKPIVLGFAFDATVVLAQSGIKCKTGETILVVSSDGVDRENASVYLLKKTEKEYESVHTMTKPLLEILASTVVKYAIYDTAVTNSESEIKFLRKMLKKNFRVLTLVERPLSSYLWDLVDRGNIKGYSVKETCDMMFEFRWNEHRATFSMLSDMKPAKRAVKIDIGDAERLDIGAAFLNTAFDHCKTYAFREPANRIVEASITFDEGPLPTLDLIVTERTSIADVPVFFELLYNRKSNTFTGSYVTTTRLPPIIENAKTPAEVFKAVIAKPTDSHSVGVLINGDGLVPFNVYKEVIKALPKPEPEVRSLYPQCYLSVILWQSGVKCDVDEYIVLAIYTESSGSFDFAVLQKTTNGFKGIGTGDKFHHGFEFKKVVVAVEHEFSDCCRTTLTSKFPGKELFVANWSKVPNDSIVDFARNSLSGQHFHGYMLERYLGMKFTFEAGGESTSIDKTFAWTFSNHVETLPIDVGKGTAKLKVAFFGWQTEEQVVAYVEYSVGKGPRNAVLTLGVDRFGLVPTAKIEVKPAPASTKVVENSISESMAKFYANQSDDNPVVIVPSTNDDNLTFLLYHSNAITAWPETFPDRAAMYFRIAKLCEERKIIGIVDQYPDNFKLCQRSKRRALLKQANLSDVKIFNSHCTDFALHLSRVNANQHVAVGETVLLVNHDIVVLKRQTDGYQVLDVSRNDLLEICKEHLTKFIVVYASDDSVDAAVVTRVKQRLTSRTVVASEPSTDASFLPTYYHSLFNGTNCNGYKVADYLNYKVVVTYGTEKRIFRTGFVSTPYDFKVDLHLGEAMSVKVAAMSVHDFTSLKPEVVKMFTMKSKERRLVSLTLKIADPYKMTASMEVLERGITQNSPRIVLIHRNADGYSRTVLTENSPNSNSETYSTAMTAMESYKSPSGCNIVVDVALATLDERTKLLAFAKQLGYGAILGIHTICLDINKLLFAFEGFECDPGESVFLMDMSQSSLSRSFVIRRDRGGYHLIRASRDIEKLRSAFPMIRRAFVAKNEDVPTPAIGDDITVTPLTPYPSASAVLYQFLASSIAGDASFDRPHISNFTGIVFTARWAKKAQNIEVGFASVPYSDTVVFHVGMAENLKIQMTSLCSSKSELVKQFHFRSPANRVIVVNLAVDRNLKPSATLVRADRVPSVGFKFTTDNRVIIRAGADYTGEESIPAYLSYTNDFNVGFTALEHMQTCPSNVVYDFVRLLANDSDTSVGMDPSWEFAVYRDADYGIMVELGDKMANIFTLFAIVIKCTLLYVKENCNHAMEEVGIQLPMGSVVSEEHRCEISERLGVNLIVYYY